MQRDFLFLDIEKKDNREINQYIEETKQNHEKQVKYGRYGYLYQKKKNR